MGKIETQNEIELTTFCNMSKEKLIWSPKMGYLPPPCYTLPWHQTNWNFWNPITCGGFNDPDQKLPKYRRQASDWGVTGGARVFMEKSSEYFSMGTSPHFLWKVGLKISALHCFQPGFFFFLAPHSIFFLPEPVQSMIKAHLNDNMISELNPAETNHKSLEWGKDLEIREMDSKQRWSLQHLRDRNGGESHPKPDGNFPSLLR